MKVLVVSCVDDLISSIVETVLKFDENAVIDIVDDIRSAISNLTKAQNDNKYDILFIDMMVQDYRKIPNESILDPALNFFRTGKRFTRVNFPKKVFALFDTSKTGDKGKDEVREMGYFVLDYSFILQFPLTNNI